MIRVIVVQAAEEEKADRGLIRHLEDSAVTTRGPVSVGGDWRRSVGEGIRIMITMAGGTTHSSRLVVGIKGRVVAATGEVEDEEAARVILTGIEASAFCTTCLTCLVYELYDQMPPLAVQACVRDVTRDQGST